MTRRNTESRNTSIWCYSNPVKEPPKLIIGYNEDGEVRTEDLLITGWFACDEEAWLANHQVDLSYACYNFRNAHFELCLLSEENHRVLCDLQLKGQFETPFYLTYSLGHLYHIELLQMREKSDGDRPILPLWSYLVSPHDQTRQQLERWLETHIPSLMVIPGGRSMAHET